MGRREGGDRKPNLHYAAKLQLIISSSLLLSSLPHCPPGRGRPLGCRRAAVSVNPLSDSGDRPSLPSVRPTTDRATDEGRRERGIEGTFSPSPLFVPLPRRQEQQQLPCKLLCCLSAAVVRSPL